MSAVAPIGDKMLRRGECSDVPIATNAPQQTAIIFMAVLSENSIRLGFAL
jgi:hypothetical protein